MVRRVIALFTGDHGAAMTSAAVHNLPKNQPKKLTDEQMENILRRHQ